MENTATWIWYISMVIITIFNIIFFLVSWIKLTPPPTEDPKLTAYQKKVRMLAFPFVLECAWRSIFPSIYASRQTFWDTPLNSILIDRTLACVGEVANAMQLAAVVSHLSEFMPSKTSMKVVKICASVAPVLAVIGECFSYLQVSTTCNLFAAIEESMWVLNVSLMTICSILLFCNFGGMKDWEDWSAKIFYMLFLIIGPIYIPYMIFSNIPVYLKRFSDDQKNHVKYFHFWEGLVDAATRRNVTKDWNHWSSDAAWMSMYFSLFVWISIFAMQAPTFRAKADNFEYRSLV